MTVPKKKILFLHRSMRQSGAVRQLYYIFCNIDKNQFDPILVIQKADNVFYKDLLTNPNVFVLTDRSMNIISLIRKFIALVKRIKPDCIQTFNRRSNWLGYAASLFYKSPPIVSSMRNTNLKFRFVAIEFTFRSCPKYVVVNSVAIRNELIRKAKIPPEKIRIIPNGLDINRFKPCPADETDLLRTRLGFIARETILISVGRIHPQKNIMCTLRAIKAFLTLHPEKALRFIHIGPKDDTNYETKILKFISDQGLTPYCDFRPETDQITDYYNAADGMILSSLWEGLPNVLIEAMACNKICFVSASSDNDRIIHHDENGFIFGNNDSTDLSMQISRYFSMSEEKRIRIGQNARHTVETRFSLKAMIKNFESLYDSVTLTGNLK